jgi:glycosyltransferase involved in cell wall biosynthesis
MQFDFEVIVVEQHSTPHVEELVVSNRAKYIFAYNAGVFNKSWAINIGIKCASYDYIFCGDNDMIVPPESLAESIALLKSGHDSVKPFRVLIDLTRFQTTIYEKIERFIYYPFRRRNFACFCSGIVGFSRSCLEDIGGWDERFRGWGGEDDAISVKLQKYNKRITTLNYTCYHLYHGRTIYDKNKHENYQNNVKLLHDIESMENVSIDSNVFLKMGDINKYCSTES